MSAIKSLLSAMSPDQWIKLMIAIIALIFVFRVAERFARTALSVITCLSLIHTLEPTLYVTILSGIFSGLQTLGDMLVTFFS